MAGMNYFFTKAYYELDPNKKDAEWANGLVTQFRNFMCYMVEPDLAKENRAYMEGRQDVKKHKDKFHKPDEMPFEFRPLAIFEKYRNILTAEREKAGVTVRLNAVDPSATDERDEDKQLFSQRGMINGIMNYAQTSVGLPPYDLMKDKDENGEKLFNGNMEDFDELGLNPNEPDDVAFFFKTYYRLDAEIACETICNYYVQDNELQEYLKLWCDDILCDKAIAGRVYCDQYTWKPTFRYYHPSQIKWVKGKRRDGKDAKAIAAEENMTVQEFLGMVGNKVQIDDIHEILDAVNFWGQTAFDGISFSDGRTSRQDCKNSISYDEFLYAKVGVGYIEWKSLDVDVSKVGTNALGNHKRFEDVDFEYKPKKEETNYDRESIWNQITYKCHYLMKGSSTQLIYDFGKLFAMETHGPEDEYSSYSFIVYKQNGQSAVEISKPYIDNFHDAWFRFNWVLNKAKPKGTRYNYDVIAKIAVKMYGQGEIENKVMKVIKLFHDSIDDFYVNDNLNQKLGGGQNPHFDKPGGLDQIVKELWDVMMQTQEQIGDKLGINAIREAYSPSPNDGYKLQMQALAQSRNATEYITRMLMSVLMGFSRHTLCLVQDHIAIEGSKAFEYLQRAVGTRTVEVVKALKKIPVHKFGIFIDTFNTDLEKQEKKQQAYEAFQKGLITYATFLLIENIDSQKRAGQILAHELYKAQKQKEKEVAQQQQNLVDLEALKHKNKMDEINAEGEWRVRDQQEANKGIIAVAEDNNQTKKQVKDMGIQSEGPKQAVKTTEKIREHEAKHNIDRNQPLPSDEI